MRPLDQVVSPHGRRVTSIPAVMGILNATPDSFYAPSRGLGETALERARLMVTAGAHILDIGGESTRPGSSYVDEGEELSRVIPLIRDIRKFSPIPISVDTRKASVAKAALEAGADWINDISALRDDPGMVDLAVREGMPVVFMHMQGTPETMQKAPAYSDTLTDVGAFLAQRIDWARGQGLPREKILVDPGIGFGKTLEDNLVLLRNLESILPEYPLLVGLSRKSFIGGISPGDPERRLGGSLAGALWACVQGASILRVHDVEETIQAIAVWKALGGH